MFLISEKSEARVLKKVVPKKKRVYTIQTYTCLNARIFFTEGMGGRGSLFLIQLGVREEVIRN